MCEAFLCPAERCLELGTGDIYMQSWGKVCHAILSCFVINRLSARLSGQYPLVLFLVRRMGSAIELKIPRR